MGMRMWKALAVCASLLVACVFGTATARADAGKVIVSTGTAGGGPASDATTAGIAALRALGTAGDYTVDVTSDATQISAANLANYRATVFLNSSGDVLNDTQEADLISYV